jgi:hypothetical protein
MISRTWHGIVPLKYKEQFLKHLDATGVKDTTALEGNMGAYVKVVEQNGYAHFFLCTIWDSFKSIISYAGENSEIAVTYPNDDKFDLVSDPIVIHQEIATAKNPFESYLGEK